TLSNFYDAFIESLQILQTNIVPFEVRTTVHADFLNEEAINEMAGVLIGEGYKGTYYLQNYLPAEQTLGNLSVSLRKINKEILTDKIKIEFRN
ncbi:MAG: anaerobic ribonucleoside-triphosphate reductase activating protein, partial [Campylobacteraceae bacterium]|nr:anaerobic ribonucleoside-triphosphate reductase activating protein [Campylobacteraceae bacterium]